MLRSLRARLVVSFAGLASLSVIMILLLMHQFISNRISQELTARANTAEDILRGLHETDSAKEVLRFSSLASEPRLKALATIDDVATLSHEAEVLRKELNSQAFAFLDPQGHVAASSQSAEAVNVTAHLSGIPLNPASATRRGAVVGQQFLDTVIVPVQVDGDLNAYLAVSTVLPTHPIQAYERTLGAGLEVLGPEGPLPFHVSAVAIKPGNLTRDIDFHDGFRYRLHLDRAVVEAPLRHIFNNIASVGVASIMAAVLVALVLAKRIAEPIRALSATAGAVQQGDLSVRSSVAGSVEVRRLANGFNRMLDQISVTQEQLRANAEELKIRFEESELLQAQLIQAQKMEAVGRVAGGVAHDFNNLLTVIIGNCQLVMTDTPREDPRHHDLEQVMRAGERAAELTRQLLVFSRKQTLDLQVMQLNDTVAHMQSMLKRILGENVHLTTHLAPDLYCVRADAGRMEQVIMNLVVNACDAMENNGPLIIETENMCIDSPVEARKQGTDPGEYAALRVSDTGCGMTEDVLARIFEPFYTTKPMDKGTGLGLSTVYGIVQNMGGTISVNSTVGEGTVFQILLKRAASPNLGTSTAASQPSAVDGTESILIVDDEEYIIEILMRALADRGYKTMSAPSGEAALELAANRSDPIDMLIADIAMPRMNGVELSNRLSALMPHMKTIYVTGYEHEVSSDASVGQAHREAIRKPFSIDQLLRRMRESLDNSCILPGPTV